MAYASPTEFVEAFGREEAIALTNLDDPTAEEIDQTVLTRALTDASQLIDSYLMGRYTLPFATRPAVLIPRCLDIARSRLHRTVVPDDVRKRYEDAIRWLEQVSKGLVSLGLDTLNAPVDRGENLPDYVEPTYTFTNDTLKDFVGL